MALDLVLVSFRETTMVVLFRRLLVVIVPTALVMVYLIAAAVLFEPFGAKGIGNPSLRTRPYQRRRRTEPARAAYRDAARGDGRSRVQGAAS